MAAPWETTADAAPAPAAPAASGAFAPWESPPPPKPAGSYIGNYASGVADQAKKLVTTPYTLKTDLQTVGALASAAVAPIAAAGGNVKWSVDDQGNPVAEADPDDHSTYRERKEAATYHPTDPNAQARVGLIGAATKPIGDALHHVASVFSDDPDTQEAIADTLGIASSAFGGEALNAVKGLRRFGPAAASPVAENIATHPAVVAANDLADSYNIKLTKGQQVAQAATGLGPEDTAAAKALTVPYQIETKAATQPTVAGKTYNNHFATQQNQLAAHVQDVADGVRALGDADTAAAIENTITTKSPGVNAVNGRKLQSLVDKDWIDDDVLAGKLNDLNDLSGVIDPPAKGPVAPATLVDKIKDRLGASSIGAAVGGAAGFKIGGAFGHPFVGAEAGSAVGGYLGRKVGGMMPGRAPGDLTNLSAEDLSALSKQTGLSSEELVQRLAAKPVAPAPGVSVPSTPPLGVSSTPPPVAGGSMATVEAPYMPDTVRARSMPTVEAPELNYIDHKTRMETDPVYRKARLLQAGIIEDEPVTAPTVPANDQDLANLLQQSIAKAKKRKGS